MKPDQIKHNEYSYSYDVIDNSIDINTLLVSQIHFTTVVNEINKRLHPDVKLNIRVVAPEKGSFLFIQSFEFAPVANLLTPETIAYIAGLFDIVIGIVTIKIWLNGKRADNIIENKNDVTIVNNGESKTVTYNVYNIYKGDVIINNAIERAFDVIDNDPAIDGLKIMIDGNEKESIAIKKDDFAALKAPNEYLDKDINEELRLNVKLFIKDMDVVPRFQDRMNWEFLYEGISKIKATITDREFIRKVRFTEIRLGAGDSLLVDLKITSKFSEAYQTFLPTTYEVAQVNQINLKPPDDET